MLKLSSAPQNSTCSLSRKKNPFENLLIFLFCRTKQKPQGGDAEKKLNRWVDRFVFLPIAQPLKVGIGIGMGR